MIYYASFSHSLDKQPILDDGQPQIHGRLGPWGLGGPGDPGLRIDGRRPQRQAFQDSTSQVGHELTAS